MNNDPDKNNNHEGGATTTTESTTTEKKKEIPWVDAMVRWKDDDRNARMNDDCDDSEEEEGPPDIFQDENPWDTFDFTFCNKNIHLRGHKAESDAIWQSTGLTLWKAAEHLCHYLIDHAPELFSTETAPHILELGAGLGLCGIVAYHLLASSSAAAAMEPNDKAPNQKPVVVLTDGDTDALVELRKNVKHNTIIIPTEKDDDDDRNSNMVDISCEQLIWGDAMARDFLHQQQQSWNDDDDDCQQTFDLILASDVIYVAEIIQPLLETVEVLLAANGKFLLAFAKRRVPVSIEFVLQSAQEAGFNYQNVVQDDEQGIFVYILQRQRDLDQQQQEQQSS